MIILSIIILCAYFIGSIPTGFIIARLQGISDITNHGSGNIGATNVGRLLGLQSFLLVFFVDCLKSFIFLVALSLLKCSYITLLGAAIALLIGNGISCFLRGRGGKGIATTFGIFLAIHPMIIPLVFLVWLISLLITKTVGIASVLAAASLPFFILGSAPGNIGLLLFSFFVLIWTLVRHKNNLYSFFCRNGSTI